MNFNLISIIITTKEWNNLTLSKYNRLYLAIKRLIVDQKIPVNTKLPPTRVLAKSLNISRSTIVKAFDLLCFEQFIAAKQGSGYYVNYFQDKHPTFFQKETNFAYPKIAKRAKLFEKHQYINTDSISKNNIAFRPGLPPLDIFPIDKWKRLSNEYWQKATPTNLSYATSEGLESLRISIMEYLNIYRNIKCDYNQILITSGSLHSLYLIGNSLIDKGDEIIMENPTFPRAYNLFKSIRAKIIPCEIDKNGIKINAIKKTKAKLIYTTPSNQYPLGIKMSKERRMELITWISKNNSLLIEDDYDYEFSNWMNSEHPLFSLDNEERVIYMGTFNKTLYPSLRVGYMIVPKHLISYIRAIYEQSSRFIPIHTQEVLNTFITKNYINKHIRNVIAISKERRTDFIQQTKEVLSIKNIHNGLHLIGKLKSNHKDIIACEKLLKANVIAYPLSNYYITKQKKEGLVLGFSSVNKKVMQEKTAIMNKILQ